ncbi:MAG: ectonucleotide pyrophosphatase/phosphodiesterase [Chloroflexota bacterium]
MSSSLPSSSEPAAPSPSDSHQQQSRSIGRSQPKDFIFKKLGLFVALAILILAYAGTVTTVQSKEAGDAATITGNNRDDLNAWFNPSGPDPARAEAPAISKKFPLEGDWPSTSVPPPPPKSTPQPTSTATNPVIDTPSPTPASLSSLPPAPAPQLPAASSPSETRYVVIISIDGMRPDALDLAYAPTLDSLRARGAYSPNAQTVPNSITLVSHASMLTGMIPQKHGIEWGLPYIGWPGMKGPSLFSEAHAAGLRTAMVFGKEKLNYLVLPNSVDQLFGNNAHDEEVKDHAVEFIKAGMPNVLFIHFPDTDRVGHAYGWMSENQLWAITFADGMIGEIVAALERGGYLNNTLLIVTADHGGHGFSHGDDYPEDRTIPWLAAGPGVAAGVTLTSHINTYDTAATALYALGLPVPENWDGRPVLEIFQENKATGISLSP